MLMFMTDREEQKHVEFLISATESMYNVLYCHECMSNCAYHKEKYYNKVRNLILFLFFMSQSKHV